MNEHLEARKKRYFLCSTRLASRADRDLLSHLKKLPNTTGWGRNQIMNVAGKRVFVKRIQVTDREMDNLHSTRNFYRLPTYYNYGVGSAGFGGFRELLSHVKTTNWVLQGAIENFPLMYHHRIVPFARKPSTMSDKQPEGYVRYWNGSKRIGQYMLDRSRANFEVLIFLEHFPYTLGPWMSTHQDRFAWMLDEMRRTVQFLQANKVIHFDAHAMNMLTDGQRVYLTDFGLVSDMDFDLDETERKFFSANKHYDEGEVIYNLGSYLARRFMGLSDSKKTDLLNRYALKPNEYMRLANSLVVNVEDIVARDLIKLDPNYVALLIKYRPIISLMNEFYIKMRAGSRKNFPFEHAKLKRLLRQVA